MLQLNPNEIIRINKLINNSLNIIDENILYFTKKYSSNPNEIEALGIKELTNYSNRLKNNTIFLGNIIHELEEATGEAVDELSKSNHSLSFYENKLISYYANNLDNEDKLSVFELCYSKDDKLSSFCQKRNFVNYVESYFKNFKPETFGMDKDTVINDLLLVYDKRGANEAYSIIHALENNCPNNYQEYSFNPVNQLHDNNHYDFSKNISNYQTNSEIININGYDYEITQVLPKDCTKT